MASLSLLGQRYQYVPHNTSRFQLKVVPGTLPAGWRTCTVCVLSCRSSVPVRTSTSCKISMAFFASCWRDAFPKDMPYSGWWFWKYSPKLKTRSSSMCSSVDRWWCCYVPVRRMNWLYIERRARVGTLFSRNWWRSHKGVPKARPSIYTPPNILFATRPTVALHT